MNEQIKAELKALCLEIAAETTKINPSDTLNVAKGFYEWVIS